MGRFLFISRNKKEKYQYFYDLERKVFIKESLKTVTKSGAEVPVLLVSSMGAAFSKPIASIIRPILTPVFAELFNIIPIPIVVVFVVLGGTWLGEYGYKKRCKNLEEFYSVPFLKEEHNEDNVWDSYRREKRELLILFILFGGMALMLLPADDYFIVAVGLLMIGFLTYMLPVVYKTKNPFSKRRDGAIELVNQIAKEQEDFFEE
jgi:hypothetical protein